METKVSLLDLPVELIIQILSYLEVSDIYNIYDTCELLKNIINDDELWKNIFLTKFKTIKFSSVTKSYKYSIELIRRQQILTKWKKATGTHKNLIIDVPNVEKLVFNYPKVISFSDQGEINILSIDKGKSEVTIPITTPNGCTCYHFNSFGSVFGRFDGKIFTKLLNNRSSYISSITQFSDSHGCSVTSIYNDELNCFSGDEHGFIFKWDLKNRNLIKKFKISDQSILKIKGSNNLIISMDFNKIHIVENNSIKSIELVDFENIQFFNVDFASKLIILTNMNNLRIYSFGENSFGKFNEFNLSNNDQFYKISLEIKKNLDLRIAGNDGCNLGLLTINGLVISINIRNLILKNNKIQPQLLFNPIFDNLNIPVGIPPISSIDVNSSVILLGSYNGFAATYDILTGDFIKLVSTRIPKRYLLLTENSFLIPVKSVKLGLNNESNGLLLINNIIQYFQFGNLANEQGAQKKVKKSINVNFNDRKNLIQNKIKNEIDDLDFNEFEDYKNEKLLNKYNGDELTDQEQIELAMVLNNSLNDQTNNNNNDNEHNDEDDDLAKALELSRLGSSFNSPINDNDLADDDYELQLQEALRRSLYE